MEETGAPEIRWPLTGAILLHIVCGIILALLLPTVSRLLGGDPAGGLAPGINATYAVVASLCLWCQYLPVLRSGQRAALSLAITFFWAASVPCFVYLGTVTPYEAAAGGIRRVFGGA